MRKGAFYDKCTFSFLMHDNYLLFAQKMYIFLDLVDL